MVTLAFLRRRLGRVPPLGAAALFLAACAQTGFDLDLRSPESGFSTRESARTETAPRPRPDSRGVISYPGYEVVVARQGDTVATVAERLQLQASVLARFNALTPDTALRAGEILALPSDAGRLGEDTIRIASLAEGAIARSGAENGSATRTTSAEPVRHQVQRGETAFTIARLYNVSPRALAEWNGLDPEMNVREGQFLLVPVALPDPASATAAAPGSTSERLPFAVDDSAGTVTTEAAVPASQPSEPEPALQPRPAESVPPPGAGSVTPVPSSAAQPLPDADEAPAEQRAAQVEAVTPASPELSQDRSASSAARLSMPVDGRVIRAYSPGRSDGIGIAASAGTPVRAAAAGTVAAITQDTSGIPIIVIRHDGNLLTVYANLDNLSVQTNARVTSGQTIADVRAGDPSFLHFEVRDGMNSLDPMTLLQ